jgi:hypothetical protein
MARSAYRGFHYCRAAGADLDHRHVAGGWAFDSFPFTEANELWRLGKVIEFDNYPDSNRHTMVAQMAALIPIFFCPSRCGDDVRPYTAPQGRPIHCDLPEGKIVISDHAAYCGDQGSVESTGGLKSLAAADDGSYVCPGAPDDDWFRFGSAHPQQFSAVFCNGSAHGIGYEIDPKVFSNLCHRSDRQSLNSDKVE